METLDQHQDTAIEQSQPSPYNSAGLSGNEDIQLVARTQAIPLMAHWAVESQTVASTDMRNPDTSTWRGDTQDADT